MPYPQVQFLPPIDVIPDFVQDQRHEPYLYLKQKIRLQESDGSNVPGFWMPPAGGIHIFYSNFAGISPADDYLGAATQLVLL